MSMALESDEDENCEEESMHVTVEQHTETPPQVVPLKTTLGRNVEFVLGREDVVERLDTFRDQLRNNPKSKFHIHRYESTLAEVQSAVLAAYSTLKREIQSWEKEFFINHMKGPSSEEKHASHQTTKHKKLKRAKDLLSHWNITLI